MSRSISDFIKILNRVRRKHGDIEVVAASDEELNQIAPVDYSIVALLSGRLVFCAYPMHGKDIVE